MTNVQPAEVKNKSQNAIVKTAFLGGLNRALSIYGIHVPPSIRIFCSVSGHTLLADDREIHFQRMLNARPEIAEGLANIFDLTRRRREEALKNAMQSITSGRQSPVIKKFLRDFKIAEAPGPMSIWFDGNDLKIQEYSNEGWVAIKTEETFIAAW